MWGRIVDTQVKSQNSSHGMYTNKLTETDNGYFWLPGGSNRKQQEAQNAEVWQTLSELPKLTGSELYVSLDREYSQKELNAKFSGLRVEPRWFAVRSGQEWAGIDSYAVTDEEGKAAPAEPEDYLNISVANPIGGDSSVGLDYIPVQGETNEEYLKYHFLSWKTGMIEALKRISQSPEVAESVSAIDFASAAEEVEKNGAKVYGVVVTGRSEELAKLQDEPWMQGAIVRLGDSVLDTRQFDPYIVN